MAAPLGIAGMRGSTSERASRKARASPRLSSAAGLNCTFKCSSDPTHSRLRAQADTCKGCQNQDFTLGHASFNITGKPHCSHALREARVVQGK